MQVTLVPPSPSLAPFVRVFMIVETDVELTRVLIPESGLVLAIRFGGSASILRCGPPIRVADHALTGLSIGARRMRTSAGGRVVLTMFRPAGAAHFFDEPLHELMGATVSLDEFVPHGTLERVVSQAAEAKTHAARVARVEQFLLERKRAIESDPLVDAAVRVLQRANGNVRIGALTRSLGISQDPLEKRFRRMVGAPPKHLASLLRLRRAVDAYRPGTSLARLSQEAGYFDQAHFTKEFRAVIGQAPAQFFKSGEYC